IAAGLAWYVPETYRPGEGVNIPPIHDIATDTSSPAQFVDVLPLRGPGTNTTDYGNWEGMTPAEQARLQQEDYPDIQPQHFTESREVLFSYALAAVYALG